MNINLTTFHYSYKTNNLLFNYQFVEFVITSERLECRKNFIVCPDQLQQLWSQARVFARRQIDTYLLLQCYSFVIITKHYIVRDVGLPLPFTRFTNIITHRVDKLTMYSNIIIFILFCIISFNPVRKLYLRIISIHSVLLNCWQRFYLLILH